MKQVFVAAIVLENSDGKILLSQRPEGKSMAGLWEFPGGKVEAGEAPEAALVREVREELGIEVAENDLGPLTFASHTYETFHLLMPLFHCTCWRGEPQGLEGQEVRWVTLKEMTDLPMPPADVPLVAFLRQVLSA